MSDDPALHERRRWYVPKTTRQYVRTKPELPNDAIAARRVDRDPCPYCGVRADIGCKHRGAA